MSRDHIIKVFWADVKNLDFILSAEETQESRDRVCLKALALAAGWGALAGMEAGGHRSLKVRQSPVRADTLDLGSNRRVGEGWLHSGFLLKRMQCRRT